MTGMCVGLAFAKGCGLDQKRSLKQYQEEPQEAGAWQITDPEYWTEIFDPGFFVKHYIKDMKLAEEAADEIGLDLPALSLTRELYEEISEAGLGEAGTQSLYCLYDPEEE